MNFDDPALEYIVTELSQHLRLGRMDDVTEIHMISHVALEGDFNRLWDRHRDFARRQSQCNRSRISAESNALGHPSVRVTTDDDRPIVNRNVIQHLMNDVGHGRIIVLRVTPGDKSEIIHELHKLWRVCLSSLVPNRRGMTTRLVSAINRWRNHRCRHGLQFLNRHWAGRIL